MSKLKIGLTGGIGSGKSTVAKIFATLGIPLFDADAVAKNIMQENKAIQLAIKAVFGEESYLDGQLNKIYISNIVFNDAFKLDQLNAIIHPATIDAAKDWMKNQETPYSIKEAAILFESGSADGLDFIIGVTAPTALRIKRIIQRDKIERNEVLKRMAKQIDEEIKMRLCDFVIVNDEQQPLIPQVLQIHHQLLMLAAQKE